MGLILFLLWGHLLTQNVNKQPIELVELGKCLKYSVTFCNTKKGDRKMEDWEIEEAALNYKNSKLRKTLKMLKEYGYKYESYIEEDIFAAIITLEITKNKNTFFIEIYNIDEENRESYMEYITEDINNYRMVRKLIREIITTLGKNNEEFKF